MKPIKETIQTTRIPIVRGEAISITIDGHKVEAYSGETIATVLLTSGHNIFQHTGEALLPRSLYCGMGICFNCLVTVDGVPNILACVTQATAGMSIETRGGDHHG